MPTKNIRSITGGIQFLMANLPDSGNYNVYYWFDGTQVMHNTADKDWDTWNRKVKKALVDTQTTNRLRLQGAGIRKPRTKTLGGRLAAG